MYFLFPPTVSIRIRRFLLLLLIYTLVTLVLKPQHRTFTYLLRRGSGLGSNLETLLSNFLQVTNHIEGRLWDIIAVTAENFLERRNTAELTGAKFVLLVHLADGRVTRHASAHD